ncbi:MAG: 2-hydroxyacyl-CoA dehydratase [Syntrophobacteraceae bacterium]
MKELLELCGYEDAAELATQMPRIRKAFAKLDITDDDIAAAKKRLKTDYEIDLRGFRKLLNIYVKEMINFALCEEEKGKRIYNTLPSLSSALGAAAAIADETVYAGFPTIIMLLIYHGIFKKMGPHWEAAEQESMGTTEGHCGCNLCKIGAQLTGLFPKPDAQIQWGIYCDDAPKADEYLENTQDMKLITINRILDENKGETVTPRAKKYFTEQLRKAMSEVSEVIGKKITDEHLWQALLETRQMMQQTEQLVLTCLHADPVPLSVNTVFYVFVFYACNPSRENVQPLQEAMTILNEEAKERVARGEGYYEKGAPRVAMHLPSFVDASIATLIKDMGLAVPCMELMWYERGEMIPDLGETENPDPYSILAMGMLSYPFIGPFAMRLEAMVATFEKYNLDGFLGLFPFSCRAMTADTMVLKHGIQQKLDVPVVMIEGDVYDDRKYPLESIRTRIESFAEMCKISKDTRDQKVA